MPALLGVLQAVWHCVRHLESAANRYDLCAGQKDSIRFRHDELRIPPEMFRSLCPRDLSRSSLPCKHLGCHKLDADNCLKRKGTALRSRRKQVFRIAALPWCGQCLNTVKPWNRGLSNVVLSDQEFSAGRE